MHFFLFILFSFFFYSSNSIFINSVFTARLQYNQIVGSVGKTSNIGVAVCEYIRYSNPPNIQCNLIHDYYLNIVTILDILIYIGRRGTSENQIYSFNPDGYDEVFNSININLNENSGYSVEKQLNHFLNGNWYIQISVSSTIENYPIRGQLDHYDKVFSILNSNNNIPHTNSNSSFGIILAQFTVNQPKRTLKFEIIHNIENVIEIQFRIGKNNEVGRFAFSLRDFQSPIFETIEISLEEQEFLLNEQIYSEILTADFPKGKIRGQLYMVDYLERSRFTSRLTGSQTIEKVNTPSRGCGIISYNCWDFLI